MKTLIILNGAPYGNENAYNALRIAMQLQKDYPDGQIWIYLIADGVFCSLANEKTPNGYYNIEKMVESIIQHGGIIKMCTSCGEARGIKETKLAEGVEWSNLKTLTDWIVQSDKVINY